MAPQQEESWDNDPSHGLISTHDALGRGTILKEHALNTTVFVANRPKSILYPPSIGAAKRTNSMPSHWPLTLVPSLDDDRHPSDLEEEGRCRHDEESRRGDYHSVSFASDIVSSIRERPRTHILDIPTLYYSAMDIKRFKREYRNLVRVQSLARERMERNSSENVAVSRTDLKPHDNSFWRSKVGRRWSVSPPRDAVTTETSTTAVQQSDNDYSLDPLNDGSSCVVEDSTPSSFKDENEVLESSSLSEASSYGGMFSSVFDVARDTLSALNGSHYTSRASPPCKAALRDNYSNKPCKATSLHLVDTLYLF